MTDPAQASSGQASGSLACGQLIDECWRCTTGADCAERCVQERGTARAKWLHAAIAGCVRVQNCRVMSCIEQGCVPQMAACRADTSTAADGASPIGLDGEWSYGGVSVVGFYSLATGWSSASSKGASYRFSRNGRYEHAMLLESRSYSCAVAVYGWSTGTFRLDGDRLTLVEEQSKVRNVDACGNGSTATRDAPLERKTYLVRFTPNDFSGEPELMLYDESGRPVSSPYTHR